MTLTEKIGQMTQAEQRSINGPDVRQFFIGSVLSGGSGYPRYNTPRGWVEMVEEFQEYALETRLGIPIIYGVDALHGHNTLKGAVIFPHNVGLGATRDPDLVERVARTTAEEMTPTGIYWNFSPVVAVPQDIRWGRTYEGYGEDTELVSTLAAAYVRGLQGVDMSTPTSALATPKHFVGDGGTEWDSATCTMLGKRCMLDQGVTQVDEATLRAIHLPPYEAAIDAGARAIMVSFSSWGGKKMHAHKHLLTDVLKEELNVEGFLVSEWKGIDQIEGDYYSDVVTSINAGIDMVMVPEDYQSFIHNLTRAVERGDVSMDRIDDAVRRILTVKFELGLFERPLADPDLLPTIGSRAHRELAREAVRKSLVLPKNEGALLPLDKDLPLVFVAEAGADDIGMQCGGWTIEWQGKSGAIIPGTTILEAIRQTVSGDTDVVYAKHGVFDGEATAEVGIAVVGEPPYAEAVGDRADLSLSKEDIDVIRRLQARSQSLVVILISGRPIIVTEHLGDWDVLIAAWLPGTEGQGVADLLFGDFPFTGKLSYTWPRSMEQVPLSAIAGGVEPLFPFGYGLETEQVIDYLHFCWRHSGRYR